MWSNFDLICHTFRYHMATKTANQQYLRNWCIYSVIGFTIALEASVCLVMFYTTYFDNEPFGPLIELCYKEAEDTEPSEEFHIAPLITLFVVVSALVVGIIYDLAMLNFLKNRNRATQPSIALVPLNQPPLISHGSADSTAKMTIPIQATALGVVNLCIIFLLMCVLVFGLGQKDHRSYFIQVATTICLGTHMPLVLLFTVKSNEKKRTTPAAEPSRSLNFHDDTISVETEI